MHAGQGTGTPKRGTLNLHVIFAVWPTKHVRRQQVRGGFEMAVTSGEKDETWDLCRVQSERSKKEKGRNCDDKRGWVWSPRAVSAMWG